MFTGIIKAVGVVVDTQVLHAENAPNGLRITVDVNLSRQPERGESIAVNGCCLTVVSVARVEIQGAGFGLRLEFDLSPETLDKTAFHELDRGTRCNIEPALFVGDSLGGHWVSGHIDTLGSVLSITDKGVFKELSISYPQKFRKLLIEKGSVAIDGISLTVNALNDRNSTFSVMIIPETWAQTTINERPVGASVQLEFDLLGKYIQRML